MKKLFATAGAVLIASLMVIGVAKAAVFDFANIADNPPGELGGQPLLFSNGGIDLEARGYLLGDGAFAYLDSGGAGLGVCGTLNASLQCNPGSDDNVTAGETLQLTFSEKVIFDSISFKDEVHGTAGLTGDEFVLTIDGVTIAPNSSLDPANWGALAGIMGTVFEFAFFDEQFYIGNIAVSAVPLPPSMILFGAALIGLGVLSRRRKQQA